MDGHDRPGLWRDRRSDARRVDVVRDGVGLDRLDDGAHRADGEPSGDVCVRRHDNPITGFDVAGPQREDKCIKTVARADAVPGATIVSPFGFEFRNLVTADIAAAVENTGNGGADLGAKFGVAGVEVQKWNIQDCSSQTAVRKFS